MGERIFSNRVYILLYPSIERCIAYVNHLIRAKEGININPKVKDYVIQRYL